SGRAADERDLVDRVAGELFHRRQKGAEVVRDTFDYGAREIAPGRLERHVHEAAAHRAVTLRRTGTGEPRQEHDATRAGPGGSECQVERGERLGGRVIAELVDGVDQVAQH